MPELSIRRSSVRELLLAIRTRLSLVTGLEEDRILIIACDAEEVPHHAAQQDLLLRLEGERPQPAIDGGGRYVNLRRRSLALYCRTHLWLDTRDSDHSRLTDSTLGHVVLEDSVVDSLENWIPLDTNTGEALSGPCELGTWSSPKKDRKDIGWVSSRIDLAVEYLRDLALPEATG